MAHKLEEIDVQMWDHCFGKYYGERPMDAKPDIVIGQEKLTSVMLLEKVGPCANAPASSTPSQKIIRSEHALETREALMMLQDVQPLSPCSPCC